MESDLRLADLSTFLAVVRSGSVSGAARSLGVTPSQASKAISRLEQQLQARLLVRGARGVNPTSEAERLLPRIGELLNLAGGLRAEPQDHPPTLTVVASAYLNIHLIPAVARALPELRLRSVDLSPGIASAWASGHTFDVALTTGSERWPGTWDRARVGRIRKALFANAATAAELGTSPVEPARLASRPFIVPLYGHQGQIFSGEDGCPLPRESRVIGHQTQTLVLALEMAVATGQLLFAPVLAARALVERGALREIEVSGWDVSDTLYLVCAEERVRAKVQRQLLEALQAAVPE